MGTRVVRPKLTKKQKEEAPEGTKWCPHCAAFVSRERFYKNKADKDGLVSYCKTHFAMYEFRSENRRRKKRLEQAGLEALKDLRI